MKEYSNVRKDIKDVLESIEYTPLRERVKTVSAMGRVLGVDVAAQSDSPEYSASHMDGYAVRASDVGGGLTRLRVVGESNPESPVRRRLGKDESARVSTGARIPEGADSVVPVEEAKEDSGWVEVRGEVERWAYVYKAGADFKKGEVLLRQGSVVRAQDIALLLSLGHFDVEVMKVPAVAILATGSELYDVGEEAPGKVLNTHGPLFANLARAAGCSSVDYGVAPDDLKEILLQIRRALDESDLVLTLGGTSVGRRDLMGEAIQSLSPQVFHHGLRMDRGRVSGVAVVRGKPLVMLPGPAQGAMNAFVLLALPIIERLQGRKGRAPIVRARLTKPWRARPRFKHFEKVVYVRLGDGGATAEPMSGDTESMTVLTESSGYVIVEEKVASLRRGAIVDVNLFPGQTSLP